MKKYKQKKFVIWSLKFICILYLVSCILPISMPALAQNTDTDRDPYGLYDTAKEAGLKREPLTKTVGSIIRTLLTFIGALLLIFIITGGIIWMTSAGDEEKIKKAKGIITSAVIGLLIIILAYTITFFVMKQVTNVGGNSSGGGGATDQASE